MLSARRLCLPLFLSTVLGCAFSLSVVHGEPQDLSHDKSAKHNDQRDKAAKKQSLAQATAQLPTLLWRDPGDIASFERLSREEGSICL